VFGKKKRNSSAKLRLEREEKGMTTEGEICRGKKTLFLANFLKRELQRGKTDSRLHYCREEKSIWSGGGWKVFLLGLKKKQKYRAGKPDWTCLEGKRLRGRVCDGAPRSNSRTR